MKPLGVPQFTENMYEKIASVIKEWEACTSITFKKVDIKDGPIIRISFKNGSQPWSLIGNRIQYESHDKPTMNLCTVDALSPIASDQDRATILHEFGHTLGLLHEHQSPLREGELPLTLKSELYLVHSTSDDLILPFSQLVSRFSVTRYRASCPF